MQPNRHASLSASLSCSRSIDLRARRRDLRPIRFRKTHIMERSRLRDKDFDMERCLPLRASLLATESSRHAFREPQLLQTHRPAGAASRFKAVQFPNTHNMERSRLGGTTFFTWGGAWPSDVPWLQPNRHAAHLASLSCSRSIDLRARRRDLRPLRFRMPIT